MREAPGQNYRSCILRLQVYEHPTRKKNPARWKINHIMKKLEVAQSRRPPLPEIVLWIAASRSPSESQTSECSDLLSRSRATFVIVAQRQPGKLNYYGDALAALAASTANGGQCEIKIGI